MKLLLTLGTGCGNLLLILACLSFPIPAYMLIYTGRPGLMLLVSIALFALGVYIRRLMVRLEEAHASTQLPNDDASQAPLQDLPPIGLEGNRMATADEPTPDGMVRCRFCGTNVVPISTGQCPACRKELTSAS